MNRDGITEYLGAVAEDVEVDHVFVGMDIDVGKDQTANHADDQRYGELLEDSYVVGAEQSSTLFNQFPNGLFEQP